MALLWVNQTGCSNECIKQIAKLTRLQQLEIDEVNFSPDSLRCLEKLTELRRLDLEVPSAADAELGLEGTSITDVTLEHLASMPALRMLGLDSTNVSQSGGEQFKRKRPDVTVRYEPR